MRTEVSRGRSTDPPRPMETERAEGTRASTYPVRLAMSLPQGSEPPYGGQSSTATDGIQWLGTLVSASVLKLVLNRLVRTRMPGGVGGVPGQPGPLSRSLVRRLAGTISVAFRHPLTIH